MPINPETLQAYLRRLCRDHPDRHVGGPGNRAANELFAEVATEWGFSVESTELPCLLWERGAARLETPSGVFDVQPGPYSPPCEGVASLAAAATVDELERGGFAGQILLLHGELAREQLMPKNFVFYNPESHQRIIAAIEAGKPLAVVAATGRNPELAGGLYPFPLIEDGDFELPTAFMKDVDGERLLASAGQEVSLAIDSKRTASTAPQLVARRNTEGSNRLVFFAHIDSKDGTPGALDNASGVCALLGLAQLLRNYAGPHQIEIVPLNGEDYYAAPGQMHWLAQNEGRLDDIAAGFNVDGAGYRGQRTAVSRYGCPPAIGAAADEAMEECGFVAGPKWPQGDHSLFVMNSIPAVAVTSENVFFIASTVAHTPNDTPDLVEPATIAEVARFFAGMVERLGR